MVAQASRRLIIISDDSKLVSRLGSRAPLPVEVVDWSVESTEGFIRDTGAEVVLRVASDGAVVRSDNGNVFLDAHYPNGIGDASALQRRLADRAGIVDSGLFLGMAEAAVIASMDGVFTLTPDSPIPPPS